MSLHQEHHFEREICAHLVANGWLYAEGDAAQYDRSRALFPADVIAWVQATQPKEWAKLEKNHGPHASDTLLKRLREQIVSAAIVGAKTRYSSAPTRASARQSSRT